MERGDFVRVAGPPGWLISGTRADGIVRIANHATREADGTTTWPAGDIM